MSTTIPPTRVTGESSSSIKPGANIHPARLTPLSQNNLRSSLQHKGTQKNLSITSNPAQKLRDIGEPDARITAGQSKSLDNQPYLEQSQADSMSAPFVSDQYSGTFAHHDFFEDLLSTPEFSENQISEHTTPQELIWERQFLPQDTAQPRIADELQQSGFDTEHNISSPSNDLQGLFPPFGHDASKFAPEPDMFGSQLTQTISPEEIVQTSTARHNSSVPASNVVQSRKRAAEPLSVTTTQQTLSPQTTRNGGASPIQRAVSPVVIVSTHNRGDSPRPVYPRARSSSKRSQRGDLQYGVTNVDGLQNLSFVEDDSSSRLKPPDPYASEMYNDLEERSGLEPNQRGSEVTPSINDLADQRQIEEKNVEVEHWLATSDTGSDAGENLSRRNSKRGRRLERPRSRTDSNIKAAGLAGFSDRNIPGPGVLLNEDSGDDYSDTGSVGSSTSTKSQPVAESEILGQAAESSYFPAFEETGSPPEEQDPLPHQFYRRAPWQDPFRVEGMVNSQDQPPTSNAAASRWNQEAAKWESASRAATWGTRRRLSESEVMSIVDGSQVRHLSLAGRGRGSAGERRSTLINLARNMIPRRNSSTKKPADIKEADPSHGDSSKPQTPIHRGSITSLAPVQRKASFGKPKSPPLDTGSAFMAMTGHLTAIGQATPIKPEPESSKSPLQRLRKNRSKSDVSKGGSKSSPGLAELMTTHGGPPMPTLASPLQEPQHLFTSQPHIDDAVDDDDDDMDDVGVRMDLKVQAAHIIPTYEGFKIHAQQLNPRLQTYLSERIAQEQIRRYKKLMENKIKHTRAVYTEKSCASGTYCFDLGGEATLLTPRTSSKDPDAPCSQFQVSNPADEEIDETSFSEGVVTPALFPMGIPLPPVKRLPAEFECPLCFKVKKFQKPSDWTKHVHEDVQPFSCTFPNCNEPKSFKRKADWVRHENERHRRLESWKCNVPDCNHVCHRKDNFVQHLVREHKKIEPKVKTRGSGSSKAKPVSGNGWQNSRKEQDDNEVLRLVEICRRETKDKPQDEPCKFCGNKCNSWKKLSVHLGKHMEQIAMPVLELVSMRDVTPDTVISPIEQNYQQSAALPTNNHSGGFEQSLSPYAMSAQSVYHSSSAGQSPSATQVHPQMGMHYNSGFYSPSGMSSSTTGHVLHSNGYNTGFAGFGTNGPSAPHQFASLNTQLGNSFSSSQVTQTPIQPGVTASHGMDPNYGIHGMNGSFQGMQQPMMYGDTQYTSPMQQHHSANHNLGSMQRMNLTPHEMNHEYMYGGTMEGQNFPYS